MARARRRWIREQGLLDSSRLVFIDETSVNTNMTRPCGRGPRGERVIGRVPFAAWKTLTFVAALRCDRMTASMMIKGPLNGEAFLAYVEQCLVPTLKRGDIVVMDNVPAHKVDGVREAIEGWTQCCAICHPIRQTSIRSRWPTVRSRRSYANVPNALKTPLPGGPDNLFEDSKPQPVPTSSLTLDMQYDRNP